MTESVESKDPDRIISSNLIAPSGIKSFSYLIGMIGFPVVIASYIVITLTNDIRSVDRRLEALTLQIDERPMSVERTTDFVIYITEALRSELRLELGSLIKLLDFSYNNDDFSYKLKYNKIDNELEALIRPIVRKHQRFSARFPSIGGNLSTYFTLSAPAEIKNPGDTEAYLLGRSEKDFAESLVAVLVNLIPNYGTPPPYEVAKLGSKTNQEKELRRMMSEMGVNLGGENDLESEKEKNKKQINPNPSELINPKVFEELSASIIDSMTIALRDQILLKVRINGSDTLK